jgi:uncharacterized membrane protein
VNRWLALLLAVIGGAAVSLATMMGFVAMIYGALWIFVFGDDPWPSWVESILNIAVPLIGLALWAVVGWLIWLRLTVRPEAG